MAEAGVGKGAYKADKVAGKRELYIIISKKLF